MGNRPSRERTFLAASALFFAASSILAAKPIRATANVPVEIIFTSQRQHANPFNDVTLNVAFTAPDGVVRKVPAFWAGGATWKVRYASASVGAHHWRSECSDPLNAGLHGVQGVVEVAPYRGENSLFRHGPIRVAPDQRHFEHADGTPFFWLGDTWWKGLCERITWDGFQKLTADRKAKGFTVVQIVAGPLSGRAAVRSALGERRRDAV